MVLPLRKHLPAMIKPRSAELNKKSGGSLRVGPSGATSHAATAVKIKLSRKATNSDSINEHFRREPCCFHPDPVLTKEELGVESEQRKACSAKGFGSVKACP